MHDVDLPQSEGNDMGQWLDLKATIPLILDFLILEADRGFADPILFYRTIILRVESEQYRQKGKTRAYYSRSFTKAQERIKARFRLTRHFSLESASHGYGIDLFAWHGRLQRGDDDDDNSISRLLGREVSRG